MLHLRLPAEITAEQYRDIRLHGLQHNPEAFLSTFEEACKLPLEEWEQRRQNALADTTSIMLFAESDGEIVGLCGAKCKPLTRIRHVAETGMVYVKKEARGQGIAEYMLRELISQMTHHTPARKMTLTVVASNTPAITLYQKLGFRTVGVQEQELLTDGVYVDLLEMELLLPKA